MKVLLSSIVLFSALLLSSQAFSHSAMFDDYFVFDDTNEGETAAEFVKANPQLKSTNSCSNGRASGYPCKAINLMSFIPKNELGGGSSSLNDIWGWTDPTTGAEIAIIGKRNGTSFVDISTPENPVVIGFLPSRNGGSDTWRDIKVYSDHAFIVADGMGNRSHGMQVFDLTTLKDISPGSTLSSTATMGTFGAAHNIVINEDTGFAYVVGSNKCSGGLYMVDISEPTNPTYAGCFSRDGYTHDAQCVVYNGPDSDYTGHEICVGYNEDTVTIIDVTDKSNPVQISRTGYQGSAYTHQGWFLDDTHSTILFNDELDEQRGRTSKTTSFIWDVSDLESPVELGRYLGTTEAIDHNLYTKDGYVFETNYRAGLRILNGSPARQGTLDEVAFFDTIPGSNAAQFSGTWSNYIWFESGNIVLSDIGTGFFVVKPDWNLIKATASK
jgi:choice-of-anchor B domain-containing protein